MSKLRQSARGQSCTLRIPGVCNGNDETVVLAHIKRAGHGKMGGKGSDLHACYACSSCHDAIDRRAGGWDPDVLRGYMLDAMIETQERMLDTGLISVR